MFCAFYAPFYIECFFGMMYTGGVIICHVDIQHVQERQHCIKYQ